MVTWLALAIAMLLCGVGTGAADSDIDGDAELSARVYERGADGAIRGHRLPDAPPDALPM